MILADASVWIDLLNDRTTLQVDRLLALIDGETLAIGDLTLTEVLQGIDREADFATAERLLGGLPLVEIGGRQIAVAAARNFRLLRSRGFTVRKTIDTLIATRCIEDGHGLLFSNRDFEPFVTHLGLISAMAD